MPSGGLSECKKLWKRNRKTGKDSRKSFCIELSSSCRFPLAKTHARRVSSGEKASILVVVAERKRIAIKTENCLLFFVLLLLHSCAIQSCCSEPREENMKAPFKTLMALMEERMKNSFCISSRLAERMNFHDICYYALRSHMGNALKKWNINHALHGGIIFRCQFIALLNWYGFQIAVKGRMNCLRSAGSFALYYESSCRN